MKLISRDQESLTVEMSDQEKSLFLAVLSLFPQVPASHHQLTQAGGLPDEQNGQQLLEESLQAEKEENRRWITATFRDPQRFLAVDSKFHLSLSYGEVETTLQILNDVRLGSWLALGSPDLAQKEKLNVNRQTAPFIQRMELAGVFEMFFLGILRD